MASITIIFAGQEQKTYQLDKPRLVVGREASCDVHIDNLGISRNHCAFVNKGEAFVVQDLNSSNGTYVNGQKITERFLNDGDEIIIGKYTLKFKNEVQAAVGEEVPAAAGPEIPDTLNTYVMEGSKIKEQVARMRAAQAADGAPGAAATGMTAKEFAKAMDPGHAAAAAAAEIRKYKSLALALLAVVIVLLIAVVLLMFGVIPRAG
jgi:predicted component of type VI protein secretion system